jgi:hypothetical protein
MMMKRKRKQGSKLLVLLMLFYSCSTDKQPGAMKINLKMFSLSFDSITQRPFVVEDSFGFKGSILLREWKDTIHFNFGYGDVDNLSEKDPTVVYHSYNIDTLKSHIDPEFMDTSKVIFTNKINYDIDEFRKQNVHFVNISGYRAKITVPREIRRGGITGVYLDSLRKDDGGRLKFNFYSSNLDSLQNNHLLEAIKSINFNLK